MDFPDFYSQGPTPCSEANPEHFFPDPEIPDSLTLANRAKKLCGDCPYKDECLAWALFNNEPGVWGGTSKNERRKMKQARARLPFQVLVPIRGATQGLLSDNLTDTLDI